MRCLCSKMIFFKVISENEHMSLKLFFRTLKMLFLKNWWGCSFPFKGLFSCKVSSTYRRHFLRQWKIEFPMTNIKLCFLYLLIKLFTSLLKSKRNIMWLQKCGFVAFFPCYGKLLSNDGGIWPVLPTKSTLTQKGLMNDFSLAYLEIITWKIKLQRSWLCSSYVSARPPAPGQK